MQLSDTHPGQRVIIVGIGAGEAGARLESIGFLPGTMVEVGRRAPMGDPTLYVVRGTQMALRRSTASVVEVEDRTEVTNHG
jgi:ferrous iron transport protein A